MKDLTMSQALAQLTKMAKKRSIPTSCSVQTELAFYPWYNEEELLKNNSSLKVGFMHFSPNKCEMSPRSKTWREVVQYFETLIREKY